MGRLMTKMRPATDAERDYDTGQRYQALEVMHEQGLLTDKVYESQKTWLDQGGFEGYPREDKKSPKRRARLRRLGIAYGAGRA